MNVRNCRVEFLGFRTLLRWNWVKKGIIMLSSQRKLNTTSGGLQRHLDFSTTRHSQTTDTNGIPPNKNSSLKNRNFLRVDKHTG